MFDYELLEDRNSFKKLMRLFDPLNSHKIQKDVVFDFFMMPGFMD
jgi:hypothetical protein